MKDVLLTLPVEWFLQLFIFTLFFFKDIQYDEIRLEDPQSKSQPGGVSNLRASETDYLYANCSHQPDEATNAQTHIVYSVIMTHKDQTEPTRQSEPDQSKSYENDWLYSMGNGGLVDKRGK